MLRPSPMLLQGNQSWKTSFKEGGEHMKFVVVLRPCHP